MPQLLQAAQLLQHDRMPEVQIRGRRIHAELDAQRAPLGEGGRELSA
jgi:hypothetical protein